MVGALIFTQPLLLWALLVLPILWLILRAVPPAARRLRFAAVKLLLGLKDDTRQSDRTPWWLLLLRIVAIAAAILGFAGPILSPDPASPGQGPLLMILDGGWAEAPDWTKRRDKAAEVLAEAGAAARPVALIRLTDPPQTPVFQAADVALARLNALSPAPWLPGQILNWAKVLPEGGFASFWFSDGLEHQGRTTLAAALADKGDVRVYQSPGAVLALAPAKVKDGAVIVTLSRPLGGPKSLVEVIGRGPDPSGIDRELARFTLNLEPGQIAAEARLPLPPELRNRLNRFEILGVRSAGAVTLADDSLKRRKVAILASGSAKEGLTLLDQTHYLRQALAPSTELIEGALADVVKAGPDVMILADIARLTPVESDLLADWVEEGGLLLRFAGPRLAASDLSRAEQDPLMPVRLREGGREIGGAMSWGEPRPLAPFPEGSPFHGLTIPPEVSVTQQVLAQPDPELSAHIIAALADGTPLVTRKIMGDGQVVLFHVTANAEWSSLPLSGLFVLMLERLAVSAGAEPPKAATLAGQIWAPLRVLDGFGVGQSGEDLAGVDGERLGSALSAGPSESLPPGIYTEGARSLALNALTEGSALSAAVWPSGQALEGLDILPAKDLKGLLLGLSLALVLADIFAALALSGRIPSLARRGAAVALIALLPLQPQEAQAQATATDDARAIAATEGVVLAYVITGDVGLDALSLAGLNGLSDRLYERTSIEPLDPAGVNIETDELAFYPFLYWPVSPGQSLPSPAAYARLNGFLRSGGMIMFDTRDGDLSATGTTSAEGDALRMLAQGLDIPPLELVPPDHILTRSFYLIQNFPGRFDSPVLWVEARQDQAEAAEGMPFRAENDGVTPVVIGGNDWASAWATDEYGGALYPIGRGEGGERQRETSYRFGINLIMHVLTGNYKSDQVHVPALLERLGQ
jgi:hypothetical protein